MSKEEKDLLLKDLCVRLPYGVKVRGVFLNYNKDKDKILYEDCNRELNYQDLCRYESLKPYLRPMSSMTEEEKAIYSNYKIVVRGLGIMFEHNLDCVTEWLLKHHFDYRGLIEKGLALEAPEGMYNTKTE